MDTETITSGPVHVTLSSTATQKMQAIVNLSLAIRDLASVMARATVQVDVRNCNIDMGGGDNSSGIRVDTLDA